MTFDVFILGSNSAIPAYGRHPTSQVVNHNEKLFLIDCGEGTQMQMSHYKIKRSKINHIFISHLHGDHYYGLIGLITSYHLMQRVEPLHLFCPKGLSEIIELNFKYSDTRLKFELLFHEIDCESSNIIFENEQLSITTIPMQHRISCCGFLFKEKKHERKIISQKLAEYKIPVSEIPSIKKGNDLVLNGNTIKNAEITTGAEPSRSYAYCADTLYNEKILPIINGVDLLYHEATFMDESEERASLTFHSTTTQAATMAKKAMVNKLLIGHFSAKYPELELMAEEAKKVFPETQLAIEGKKFNVSVLQFSEPA